MTQSKNIIPHLAPLFFCCLILSTSVKAQIESDMDYGEIVSPNPEKTNTTGALPVGIYTNFNQLKTLNAQNNTQYTLRQRKEFWGYTYQLMIGDTKKKENKVYAYSNGENIYLNARNFRGGNYFVRIEHYGKYNFFRAWMNRRGLGIGLGVGIGPVGVGNNNAGELTALVLNTENGEVIRLAPKKMKILLSAQPELLKAYSQEKNRGQISVMEHYILLLNEASAK